MGRKVGLKGKSGKCFQKEGTPQKTVFGLYEGHGDVSKVRERGIVGQGRLKNVGGQRGKNGP